MLFSSLFSKEKQSTDVYFGLLLQSHKAWGFIYEIVDGKITIRARESTLFSNGWEDIVDDIDKLLALLEDETQLQIENTIFYLYSTLLETKNGTINEPYKSAIKKLVKELELKPLGYIECFEAVKDELENRIQGPYNGTLLEVDQKHVSIHVYKGGKQILAEETSRTDALSEDVSELFHRKDEHLILPSRITVYGYFAKEDDKKELQEHVWDESLFVQMPRVEFLEDAIFFKSLSDTFLKQMGQEPVYDKEEDLAIEAEQTSIEDEALLLATKGKKKVATKEKSATKKAQTKQENTTQSTAAHGFLIGQDINELPSEDIPDEAAVVSPTPPTKEKLGFTIHGMEEDTGEKKEPNPTILHSLKSGFGGIKMPQMSLGGLMPRIPAAGFAVTAVLILVLAGAIGAAEYYLHKITLSITFPAEKVSDEIPFTLTVGKPENGFEIKEDIQTTELSESTATTGTKEVGEKATGQILLHNFGESPQVVAAGTAISVDGLTYTLNDAVSIPAAKETIGASGLVKEPGKVSAAVQAEEIGEEYNISQDKRMAVGGFAASQVFALSDGEFGGGSKDTVPVVSSQDEQTLAQAIEDQAKKQQSSVKGATADGNPVLEGLTEIETEEVALSTAVGQEAQQVSMKGTLEVRTYAYDEDKLKNLLISKVSGDVPDGYAISPQTLSYSIAKAEKKDKVITLVVHVEAAALKEVQKKEIKERISGKHISDVDFILENSYDATKVEVEPQSPFLFFINNWMPFLPDNIEVKVRSE